MERETDLSALEVWIVYDREADYQTLNRALIKAGIYAKTLDRPLEMPDYLAKRPIDLLFYMGELTDEVVAVLRGMKAVRKDREFDLVFVSTLYGLGYDACEMCGFDDYFRLPLNMDYVKFKLASFKRRHIAKHRMMEERDNQQKFHDEVMHEQRIATDIFKNIFSQGALTSHIFKVHLSPYSMFNGDVLVSSQRQDGSLLTLLGDFTGHGLPASIGGIPVAEAFYAMCYKNLSLEDILKTINRKLKIILPTDIFCAMVAIELDADGKTMRVWNGGMPSPLLYCQQTKEVKRFQSADLPLGILPSINLDESIVTTEVSAGDRVFLYSDGIVEGKNERGEMFGIDRLADTIIDSGAPDQIFDHILEVSKAYCGDDLEDDESLCELCIPTAQELQDICAEKMPIFDKFYSALYEAAASVQASEK